MTTDAFVVETARTVATIVLAILGLGITAETFRRSLQSSIAEALKDLSSGEVAAARNKLGTFSRSNKQDRGKQFEEAAASWFVVVWSLGRARAAILQVEPHRKLFGSTWKYLEEVLSLQLAMLAVELPDIRAKLVSEFKERSKELDDGDSLAPARELFKITHKADPFVDVPIVRGNAAASSENRTPVA